MWHQIKLKVYYRQNIKFAIKADSMIVGLVASFLENIWNIVTYLTITTSDKSFLTPFFLGSYSTIIGRI